MELEPSQGPAHLDHFLEYLARSSAATSLRALAEKLQGFPWRPDCKVAEGLQPASAQMMLDLILVLRTARSSVVRPDLRRRSSGWLSTHADQHDSQFHLVVQFLTEQGELLDSM